MKKTTVKKEPFNKEQMKHLIFLVNHESAHHQAAVRALSIRLENMRDTLIAKARLTEFNEASKPQPKARYCVIGDKASCGYAIYRNWFNTQDGAEVHAESLINAGKAECELFVVKVVSTVKRKRPDMEVTKVSS